MTSTCAHPHCRRSLGEHPVTCPHGLTFCEHCTWEEVCDECATDAHEARLAEVKAAFAAMPDGPPPAVRQLEPPCRCGWRDVSPLGTRPVRVPIRDLTDTPGIKRLEASPTRRTCAACAHPIQAGQAAVVHRLTNPGSVFNRYHPECVEIR